MLKKKYIGPRRAKHKTRQVWSFSLAVIALCAAVVSGMYIERSFGYRAQIKQVQVIDNSHQNEQNRHLILQGIGQMGDELATLRVKYENIELLAKRLAQSQGIKTNKGEVGQLMPHADGSQSPMESQDFQENPTTKSAEQIGRELDELRQKLSLQEDGLRVLEFLAQRKAADLERIPTTIPVSLMQARFTSGFGNRLNPVTHVYTLHAGQDFAASIGSPIYAASAGIVSSVGYQGGYGLTLEIDHGGGMMTRYAHCSEALVKEGDLVTRKQIVARIGNTGQSTGPHLHFEVRIDGVPVDPIQFLGQDFSKIDVAKESSLLQDIGTQGAVLLNTLGTDPNTTPAKLGKPSK